MTDQRRDGGGIFQLTVTRPVAVAMAFATLLIFGWESLQRLPTNLLPEISYPRVTVRAEYPGAAPEDVEERVSKRLHEALSVLTGLESISSISRAGSCDVTLEFVWGTELTFAIQDIRERLDRTILPLEVETPIILRYDPTLDPILSMGLTGGRGLIELRRLAEDRLAPAISTIEGVAAVRVRGGLEDEIQVRLRRDRLSSHGLSAAQVAARLSAENVNLASGTVLEGDTEYLVRILNEYRHPSEIERTIIKRDASGVVRLSDVADVRRTHKERDVITRINGGESVELQVFKEADANIVELARRVRDRTLGTAAQRAYARGLRDGTLADPGAELEAVQAELRADPELARRVSARFAAQQARARGGDGGGSGQDGTDAADGQTDADAEEVAADADAADGAADAGAPGAPATEDDVAALVRRLEQARRDLRKKDESFDYLAADLPADVRVHLLSDQSRFIEQALDEVRDSGLFGALLAVVVLYLFLTKIKTLIVAIAIPMSVLVTFVPLHLSGTTLNVMSLGGLALGIGMVVDNSIVVLEAIVRFREQGMGRSESALAGVREMAGAATASTLTTVAVFAPIVFVEGIAGQVFRDLALTVVASLLVSLLVALVLVPMLASRYVVGLSEGVDLVGWWSAYSRRAFAPLSGWRTLWRPRREDGTLIALRAPAMLLVWPTQLILKLLQWTVEIVGRLVLTAAALATWVGGGVLATIGFAIRGLMALPARAFTLVYGRVHRAYAPFIARVIGSPTATTLTLLSAAALLAWTVTTAGGLGSEMLPEVHQGEIVGRLAMPVGTPLESTDRIARIAERLLEGDPRVAWVSATVGVPRDEVNDPDEGEHTARVDVGLRPARDMAAEEEAVMAALRGGLGELPELRDMRFERPALFTVRSPLAVEIKGDDLGELARAAGEVETLMRAIPGLRDVKSSVQPGSPEVMLSFDRDLISRYGLDTRTLARTIADLVQGSVATRFSEQEHRVDVLVQMDKTELQSLSDLLKVPVNPTSATSEPLSALVALNVREGPREIRRIWGQRAAVVAASPAGFDIGSANAAIRARLPEIEHRYAGVTLSMSGQAREMEGALDQMTMALLLAVFLVYVVMASIFESLLQPLIIMVTVPLAFFGAVAVLWWLDIPLSVVVFIGGIILAGIVVNNAIVLIDACNRRRRIDGLLLEEAVAVACEQRLRPILMTTLTTVLGLLPLTGWLPWTGGAGTELRAPMAATVVGGLSFATVLTLVVIPTVYVLVERMLQRRAPAGAREPLTGAVRPAYTRAAVGDGPVGDDSAMGDPVRG